MPAAPFFADEPPLVSPAGPVAVEPAAGAELRLAEAEDLTRTSAHAAALDALDELWPEVRHHPPLALRHRLATAWAEMYLGRLDRAAKLLAQAELIVRSPLFGGTDRAAVLFRRGCVALKRSEVADATALFTRALEENARSGHPLPLLAADILNWRSRCHQLRRDWDAAARDAEASLALAGDAGDELARAHALFQVSLVAGRQAQWLIARCNAEQALEIYRRHGDVLSTARILNNLGGIDFLLGDLAAAFARLEEAAFVAALAGSDPDVAQATSSLAQVLLRSGRSEEARAQAFAALELLDDRVDFLEEIGNTQLVVAQSLAHEQATVSASAWFDRAERTFVELGSTSQLAAVYVARGDLRRATGDVDGAADLYRRAAELLQDFHF